ncbi:hypothetical protein CCY99_00360 [Helicobacter sp. 16-1353]|uniref:glucosyltransferase domain-containing protein n=1 Tax=Helicobacter sp. 16-1353 TaxID=2004996 RepID=UPI000DCC1ABC|nr:glucosyltransferase domain-containing protein [Helicobacter sp. 16-1353]RAX55184.1 hypothetical protein CCY99_00360 [Helicobacter sp. 16-1353]
MNENVRKKSADLGDSADFTDSVDSLRGLDTADSTNRQDSTNQLDSKQDSINCPDSTDSKTSHNSTDSHTDSKRDSTNSHTTHKNLAKTSAPDLLFLAILRRFYKENKFGVLFAFIIYLLGTFSLILANFNYIDDIDRSIFGTFGFNVWDRYTASLLSGILRLNADFLLNIFPYSLFISIFLLSFASIVLLNVVDWRLRKSKIAILASTGLGLSPYYLECLSYKFDSPFMALGVLASIFPFLFIRHKKIFFIISVFCILIMLTSYQSSSGIYLMLVLFLSFRSLIGGGQIGKAKNIFIYGFLSYFVAGLIFLLAIYTPIQTYANNEMLPLKYLFIGFYKHINQYINVIYGDFNATYLSLVVGLGVIFVAKSVWESKIVSPHFKNLDSKIPANLNPASSIAKRFSQKIPILFLSIIILFALFIASFGLYLLLVLPHYYPRSLIGFGAFVSILAIYSISFKTKILKICSIIIILGFTQYNLTFANAYGEVLNDHNAYQRFRFTLLFNDLGKFLDNSQLNDFKYFNIRISGNAGDSSSVALLKEHYPLMERLVPVVQNSWSWSYTALLQYGVYALEDRDCVVYENSARAANKIELLSNTYFHKIERFKIDREFKNGEMRNEKTCYVTTYKDLSLRPILFKENYLAITRKIRIIKALVVI